MGDEEEQRQTLDALMKAIDEDPLSRATLPVMRLVFLDAGPLGLLTNPRGRSKPDQCRRWVNDLAAAGVRVFVPEIADYEVRRKLIHIGATAGVRRLDQVKATLGYAPLTTEVMISPPNCGRRCEGRVADGSTRGVGWRLHTGGPGPGGGWPARHRDRSDGQRRPPVALCGRPIVGNDHGLTFDISIRKLAVGLEAAVTKPWVGRVGDFTLAELGAQSWSFGLKVRPDRRQEMGRKTSRVRGGQAICSTRPKKGTLPTAKEAPNATWRYGRTKTKTKLRQSEATRPDEKTNNKARHREAAQKQSSTLRCRQARHREMPGPCGIGESPSRNLAAALAKTGR